MARDLGRGRQAGFSLMEMMIAVAITGVLAALAIPSFMKYTRKAKTAEAREFLRRMYDGARAYYVEPDYLNNQTIQPKPAQFPTTPVTGPADGWVADPNCCATGGSIEKCQPNQLLWGDQTWIALHFAVPEPHYYAYKYIGVVGGDGATDGSHRFTALARGNLDCDAVFSEYSMFGLVHSQYADGPAGTGLLRRVNEIE